ncbi:MAG TPA: hypothetical protein VEV17_11695 [Bryobacteraceae bacterium]|nr:hypothetical protein [Bryobacteraceae bacterium]
MLRISIACILFFRIAAAQDQQPEPHDMSHMQMGGMNEAGGVLMNLASGTSMSPQSWPMPMRMLNADGWNLMFMGQAFLVDTQQTGPRGDDKFYSANWGMFAASHNVGQGSLMFETMLSLDPATITNRRYPELFQTGETAYGKPLVDAQHPHDFVMGLGIHYAYKLAEQTTLQLYFAPVGDPALGPVAFPHRASAAELPQAPIGHHWQDSTHVANEVVTVGILHKWLRLEASGFYGTEPDESRWNIDYGPINSWSTRLSVFPARNWMAQVSVGRLARPEQQEPGDVVRSTASLQYTRPMQGSSWSTSLIWGRNHKMLDHRNSNAYLLESVAPYRRKNFFTGRVEMVDKDELFSDQPDLEARLAATAGSTFRIGAYTLGYTRDIGVFNGAETGIGANFTAYTTPAAIKPYYGDHPVGFNVYIRVRLKPE